MNTKLPVKEKKKILYLRAIIGNKAEGRTEIIWQQNLDWGAMLYHFEPPVFLLEQISSDRMVKRKGWEIWLWIILQIPGWEQKTALQVRLFHNRSTATEIILYPGRNRKHLLDEFMEGRSIRGRSLQSVGVCRKISLNTCPFLVVYLCLWYWLLSREGLLGVMDFIQANTAVLKCYSSYSSKDGACFVIRFFLLRLTWLNRQFCCGVILSLPDCCWAIMSF